MQCLKVMESRFVGCITSALWMADCAATVNLEPPALLTVCRPPLFVSWSQVANLQRTDGVHKDHEACPYDELKAAIDHPTGLVPGEKDFFLEANDDLLSQLENLVMPLESIATQVFQAIYQRQQAEISWIALLWAVAELNKYWI